MMKLTKEQECLLNIEGSTILKAGPGSGKTTSIAALVNKYLTDWKEEYNGVAIISFSNSGIKELKDKIKTDIVYPHYIGTIDGFIENAIELIEESKIIKDFFTKEKIKLSVEIKSIKTKYVLFKS